MLTTICFESAYLLYHANVMDVHPIRFTLDVHRKHITMSFMWTFRPQHLKDMLGVSPPQLHQSSLVSALASFTDLVLQGRIFLSVSPLLLGACLIAVAKKKGWVRSIAVVSTLCRLVAKVACGRVANGTSALLSPHQLGFKVMMVLKQLYMVLGSTSTRYHPPTLCWNLTLWMLSTWVTEIVRFH